MPDSSQSSSEFLALHRQGQADAEFTAALRDAVIAAQATNKMAQVNLVIKVKPQSDGRTVIVVDDIVSKLPRHDRSVAHYYIQEDGGLSRDDPTATQLHLLKPPVTDNQGRTIKVDPSTGAVVTPAEQEQDR
jgi:hypothetical protein